MPDTANENNRLNYRIFPVTAFRQNATLLWCSLTRDGLLIDPGGEPDLLTAEIAQEGVKLTKILLTHGHIDHVGAAQALARAYDVPIIGPHSADTCWLSRLDWQAEYFGSFDVLPFKPDRFLEEGDLITCGTVVLEVYHTPGHTPGHIVFYSREAGLVWVGDVLFRGSIGKSDFPFGDEKQLLHSIHAKLVPLGDEVTFIPGHGPSSTLGYERKNNPFLQKRY